MYIWFFSCALSAGSLACLDVDKKLNIVSLTKANKDRLSVDVTGDQVKPVPGSPIPAFVIKNKNIEKLIYVKDNKANIRSLTTRSSSYIYTYMADRHILLQVSSPTQVCMITLKIICYELLPPIKVYIFYFWAIIVIGN